MNPDIEVFLQEAFKGMERTNPAVGRVLVEPEYESQCALGDTRELRNELSGLLDSVQLIDSEALKSHSGLEVGQLRTRPLLQGLIRRITLHADAADGPWVEVAPPGNWI